MNIKRILPSFFEKYIESKNIITTIEGEWEVKLEFPSQRIMSLFPNQEVLIIANNGIGDYLFLKPNEMDQSLYDETVYVFWHEEKVIEVIAENIRDLLFPTTLSPVVYNTIYYYGGEVDVKLGDEVSAKDLFLRKTGRVVYIPGISKQHKEFERDGMAWIGIRFPKGSVCGVWIDPTNCWVKRSIRFLRRSQAPVREIDQDDLFV